MQAGQLLSCGAAVLHLLLPLAQYAAVLLGFAVAAADCCAPAVTQSGSSSSSSRGATAAGEAGQFNNIVVLRTIWPFSMQATNILLQLHLKYRSILWRVQQLLGLYHYT
jgi:hypothetical protein